MCEHVRLAGLYLPAVLLATADQATVLDAIDSLEDLPLHLRHFPLFSRFYQGLWEISLLAQHQFPHLDTFGPAYRAHCEGTGLEQQIIEGLEEQMGDMVARWINHDEAVVLPRMSTLMAERTPRWGTIKRDEACLSI